MSNKCHRTDTDYKKAGSSGRIYETTSRISATTLVKRGSFRFLSRIYYAVRVLYLREDPLIEVHEDGVLLGDLPVEDALHVTMCAQCILKVNKNQNHTWAGSGRIRIIIIDPFAHEQAYTYFITTVHWGRIILKQRLGHIMWGNVKEYFKSPFQYYYNCFYSLRYH